MVYIRYCIDYVEIIFDINKHVQDVIELVSDVQSFTLMIPQLNLLLNAMAGAASWSCLVQRVDIKH